MITLFMLAMACRGGGMADAQVSGTCGGNTMWVQLPSSAPSAFGLKSDNFSDRKFG